MWLQEKYGNEGDFLIVKLCFFSRIELYSFEVASIAYVYELSIATWMIISKLMLYCVIGRNIMEYIN
jgi:hypothetical protein